MTLSVKGLQRVAKLWAASEKHDDYRLSPINGDVSQLRDVLVCVGTREIMYPDSALFVQKLRDAGVLNLLLDVIYPIFFRYTGCQRPIR